MTTAKNIKPAECPMCRSKKIIKTTEAFHTHGPKPAWKECYFCTACQSVIKKID